MLAHLVNSIRLWWELDEGWAKVVVNPLLILVLIVYTVLTFITTVEPLCISCTKM